MNIDELVVAMADAIGHYEGFYLTAEEASARRIAWPTVAQRHGNPGNLRSWGKRPIVDGYAMFTANGEPDVVAGRLALNTQVRKLIGRALSLRTAFGGQRDSNGKLVSQSAYPGYAPSEDKNNPDAYAKFVLEYIQKRYPETARFNIDVSLRKMIDAPAPVGEAVGG